MSIILVLHWAIARAQLCRKFNCRLKLNVPPPLSKFFSQTWPRLTGEIKKLKSIRNKSTCKYYFSNQLSRVYCSISFRNPDKSLNMSFSLLIQISSPRRNNKVFTSVIYNPLGHMFRYSSTRVLSCLRPRNMTWHSITAEFYACPTHQARTHFYITPLRRENLASRENYASELCQVMIKRLSKVGRTSC